ncbi:MAG: class I SAM-dependent methyltransferase [Egibacteraceae bacterium]
MSLAERTFPLLYRLVTGPAERGWLGRHRAQLLRDATGTVVEIGAGLGANLPYYRGVERVVVTEPSRFMLARIRTEHARVPVEIAAAPAEALPLARHAADAAVSVCVLCSVRDVEAALAEIARVLRAGGQLLFLEHVRGAGRMGRVQDRLDPLWCRVAAGCHLNRMTLPAIEAAGFQITQLDRFAPPLPGGGLMPMVQGVARLP